VVVFIRGAWLLLRNASRRRAGLTALLLLAVVLAPIQLATGYSLASVVAPLAIDGISFLAYLATMIAVWRKSRLVSVLGLAIPVIGLIAAGPGLLLVLSLRTSRYFPVAEGRISPTASYRIFQRYSIWGGTPYYGFTIYRNPRWFPVIEKEAARGATPCGNELHDTTIGAGQEENVVVVTCRSAGPGNQQAEIPLR
jgi:hypothetical protein